MKSEFSSVRAPGGLGFLKQPSDKGGGKGDGPIQDSPSNAA